jgi:uncharacterized protein (DUF1800 family)
MRVSMNSFQPNHLSGLKAIWRSARLGALAFLLYAGAALAAPANFESRSITTPVQNDGNQWNSVTFTRTFASVPVVVMGPATQVNSEQCVIRVRNVTTTGFQYQIDEWDYRNGFHPAETVHFFALTVGTHVFGTQRWQVGRVAAVNRSASTVSLSGFSAAPVVLGQVETTVNTSTTGGTTGVRALRTRINNVGTSSFQVNLITQESDTGTISNEGIGYMAVSQGRGYLDGKVLNAVRATAAVTSTLATITFPGTFTNPVLIAQTQTVNEADPGELKMASLSTTSVQLRYQEETSLDTETTHAAEDLGYIVLGDMGGETAAKIEVGDLDITQSSVTLWTKVNLSAAYTTPVVVMGPLSYTNTTPVTIRVRNVLATDASNGGNGSFEFQVDRWDHVTTAHNAKEHLSYLAIESGTYAVGGTVWQAGRRNSVTQTTGTQALSSSFPEAPAVFAQVATVNDANACTARISAVSATSFGVELNESEIDTTPHAGETVHWIAMTRGTSNLFSSGMRLQAGQVTNNDSAFRKVTFSRMHADPFLFAAMQTKNDTDPATIRWRYLFADQVSIVAQEDNHPLQPGEGSVNNSHSAETTAFLIVQGAVDTDEDGAPDAWETSVGLNPNSAADGSQDPDGDTLTNQQEYHNRLDFATSTSHTSFTGGIVTASVVTTNAYEINDRSASPTTSTNARLRINRNGAFAPLTVNFSMAGTAATDANRAPASSADYTLWTAGTGGTQLTTSINLPAEAQTVDIYIRPVVDTIEEYVEGLRMTIGTNGSTYTLGTTTTAVALINDAQNIPANERLFVGTFLPQASSGAITGASGFATIILNGSNTAARISTTFNGLTTPQTEVDGSHVHYANSQNNGVIGNGTIVFGDPVGLPNGPLVEYPWAIVDSGGAKAQDLINAFYRKLTGVGLYVNVHTERYAGGEIRADLNLQTGSATFTAPSAAPALENLANDEVVKRDVARFLTQATFGPTEAEIDALFATIASPKTTASNRIAAYTAWINNQWSRDQTSLYDYTRAADSQEWALWGERPDLPDGLPPPNNPADWTRWGANGYRAVPVGLNKESYDPDNNNRRQGWWAMARYAHDQLRQRAAFALEQIFIVSDREGTIGTRAYGHARYFDMLADAADGTRSLQPPNSSYTTANGSAFTVRHLLEDLTKSSIMGQYLSHLRNQKATFDGNGEQLLSPDENYAREIMQLFSIGLFELHPDGTLKLASTGQPIATYNNEDIKELSRVFTGFGMAWKPNTAANSYIPTLAETNFFGNGGGEYFHPGFENPMKIYTAYHEEGTKNFLTANIAAYSGSSTDTAAREAYAEADIDTTMNLLFNHPNIGPFISKLLIQRLVTSNPTRGYVYRVAQVFADDNGATAGGVRGNLRAVINAILLDYEARSMTNVDPQTINNNTSVNVSFGKVKEPIIRYMQLLRAFSADSSIDFDEVGSTNDLVGYGLAATQADNYLGGGTQLRYGGTVADLMQQPNNMPSVFNWYLPDYSPGGTVTQAGLVAPELQIMTENSVVRAINYHRTIATSNMFDATLPTGQTGRNLLGDTTNIQDNIVADITALNNAYRDFRNNTNNTNLSSATWLVDKLDSVLCAGSLKVKYPYVAGGNDPRSIMIDQLAAIANNVTPITQAQAANRVRAALYLITSSPDYIVQK